MRGVTFEAIFMFMVLPFLFRSSRGSNAVRIIGCILPSKRKLRLLRASIHIGTTANAAPRMKPGTESLHVSYFHC